MKQNILLESKKMAKEAGFHDVRQRKPWKGFEVLEPIFTDGILRFTGYPQYLLVKGDTIQWARGERCEEIMRCQRKN